MAEYKDVLVAALDETLDKFRRFYVNPDEHIMAVRFALGLFSGITLRRMFEFPDPDTQNTALEMMESALDEEPGHPSGCVCADCSGADLTAEND